MMNSGGENVCFQDMKCSFSGVNVAIAGLQTDSEISPPIWKTCSNEHAVRYRTQGNSLASIVFQVENK